MSGTYIAHGALIENIILAAPLSGLATSIRLLPDSADLQCTAEITFTETTVSVSPLAESIRDRHTNRKPYESRLPAPEALSAFPDAARPIA
ncbi:MAG: hypothetical protein B7W98_02710, partial [Parcubacteria group bacterium 20-58-5]